MIYVGDLSSNDVNVLTVAARSATSILEFGVGGSTQIFAQATSKQATIVSLDTNHDWIAKTGAILQAMELQGKVVFRMYNDWLAALETGLANISYDLLFDDGIDCL